MAKGNKSAGGRGLNIKAKLDVAEAKRNGQDLLKILKELNIQSSFGYNPAPISNYRQQQLLLQESLRNARLETERLKQEQQSLKNQVEQGKVAQQTAKTAIDNLRIAEQQLINQLRQGKITQQDYNTQITQGKIALQAQNATLNQSRIDTQNARTALVQYNLEQKKLAQAQREARNAMRAASGSYNEAQQRLKQLGNQIRSVAGGFAATGPIQQARIKEYRRLNEELKKFDATMGNHQRNVGNYKSALSGIGSDLVGLASGYLSAAAALQTLLTNTMEFQRIKTPLTFILGSEGAANSKLAELKELANELGLEYFTLARSYKSFAAAARASNFDLAGSEKIFRSVTKASAVLGLSSDQLEGALLALQQMISKGNVQAEELRGQLSERLPGAFSLAAKAMGVTEKELNKLLQTGSVTANDLLPKLADQLDKAYGDKAAEGISGLNAELGKLQSVIQAFSGEGSFLSKNLFEPIVRGARLVINELNQLTRGSFGENLRYLFTFSDKAQQNIQKVYDLRDSNKNNGSELDAAQKKDLSGSSLGDLRTYYSQLDQTYRKAVEDYKEFQKGINDGSLKETATASLASYAKIANGLLAQRKRVGQELILLKKQQTTASKEVADAELTSVAEIRKRITALQKLDGSAIDGSDIDKRIKALQARLKNPADTSTRDAKAVDSAAKAQRTMQAEIDALTKKGKNKQKSEDEQELADVDAKYKKLRDKAIEYNKAQEKIDAARIKGGKKALGLRVDLGGLNDAQSKEEDALRDKQASDKLKKTLDKEQDLYAAYEEAKTKIGKDKAAERYQNQIDTDRSYLESLEMQREAILNPQKSKGGDEVDVAANQQQLKVLNEAIEKEKAVQQKKYDDLLASLQTFEQESKSLTEQYESDKADLIKKNDTAQLEQATQNYNKKLAELGDNHLKELDAFKLLYAGIDDLSDKNALKVLGNAEDALKELQTKGVVLSKELVAELSKLFKTTKTAIAERMPDRIIALANQIDGMASAVGNVDEAFGKVLSTLGNVVGQVGNVKKGLVDFKTASASGDAFGSVTAGLGIFTAGISIISSVVKLFDKSAQREEQAAYARDLQNKQTEALNKALERQIALLNDAYGTDRINKYSAAIKEAQDNEAKYRDQLSKRLQLTGNKQLDEQIMKFNNGEKQTGVFGNVFTELYKKGAFASLPTDIASLQKLLDEGKLDASTATIVENLIKANQSAQELANNLNAENVGSSLDELADTFLSTLTDGTRDFGKSFEEVIRKSIINGFKQKLIEEQLQPFYTEFAELSKGGLTAEEIKTLQNSYMSAADKAKQMAEDLKKATGIDITSPLKDKEGISGVITSAGLTEDTANRAMGLWQGQFDQTKRIALSSADIYRISVYNLNYVKQIAANTKRGADNTDGIGDKLDAIIANTDTSGGTSLSQALRNSGVK